MLKSLFKNVISEDLLFEIARGAIPGLTEFIVTGNNPELGTGLETIWDEGGIYTCPPSPLQFSLSSASAQDSQAGTGAHTVFLAGLDANGYWQYETVNLNGQSAVLTTKTYSCLNIAYNIAAGSSGRNLGKIYIGTGTPTGGVLPTIYGSINGTANTFDNTMKRAVLTIPKGYVGHVTGFVAGSEAAKELTLAIYSQLPGQLMRGSGEIILYQSPLQITLRAPISFPEMTKLELRGFSDVGDLFVRANMSIILERKDTSIPFILPNGAISDIWWVL